MKLAHIVCASAVAFSAAVEAQATTSHVSYQAQAASGSATAPEVDGQVRRIDKEQGKVTLKHGPIPNLGMTGMTMVFRVADPKHLEGLKEGDKVRFTADRLNGVFTVTSIVPAE